MREKIVKTNMKVFFSIKIYHGFYNLKFFAIDVKNLSLSALESIKFIQKSNKLTLWKRQKTFVEYSKKNLTLDETTSNLVTQILCNFLFISITHSMRIHN